MSDKHPDRIDASTGPSQWSLKQKRAMEAQIMKGAVKVLPRPDSTHPSISRFSYTATHSRAILAQTVR